MAKTITPKPQISALVIAKNESAMIEACLNTLEWCDEIIVIDNGSTDDTAQIAESKGAKVISFSHPSFARLREEAQKRASHEWLLYIDADERVVPTLAKEIMVRMETSEAQVLRVKRSNVYFGQKLEHGGWGDDVVERVFLSSSLQGWYGDIHESPQYSGTISDLTTPLIHLTHRDVISGLQKTVAWTPMEAIALYEAGTAQVTFATLIRKGVMEFVRRAFLKQGYKEGIVGMIESLIQGINRILVYIQVWELQQKPPLPQQYERIEKEVTALWNTEKKIKVEDTTE